VEPSPQVRVVFLRVGFVVFVKGGLVHIDRSNAERIMATLGLTLSLLLVLAIVALAFS
jgi:hypothetical protein